MYWGFELDKVLPPNLNDFICGWLEVAISYACHDANKNAKSGKILCIFQYKAGAVTILPLLQESRPEILEYEEG